MSVLITAVMLLQMVGIVGQAADVPDIILDIAENGALASNVLEAKGTKYLSYPANGGKVSWATKGCVILNANPGAVTWNFDVATSGEYDIYIAYGSPTGYAVSAYTGDDLGDVVASGVIPSVYPNENGSISNDSMYFHPVETKIAENVAFYEGKNKLKITSQGGTLYNVKLVYKGEIQEVIELPYEMLSGDAATVTSIQAKDFDAKSDGVTVSGEKVTIPAGGSVSYNVNVPTEGDYRIWVRTSSSGTIKATISGVSEVTGITMGEGIPSKPGINEKYRDSSKFVMGVYNITPNEKGTTITFSPQSAAVITKLDFIKVSDIPVATSGEAVVNMADYKWRATHSSGYESVYIWKNDNMPAHLTSSGYAAPGAICSLTSWQYVTHELNLEKAGIYTLKAYISTNASGKSYGLYVATGNTLEELAKATPQIIERDGTGAADANIFEFSVSAATAGKFYVTTGFKSSASLHATYNGFTIEYVGGNLEVDTVKANTGASVLEDGDTISKGADTFAVKFSRNVETTSVKDETIGLYDGDTKLDTYKTVENDTVYLTVKKALDAEKTYTIKVDGVYDGFNSVVTGYAFDVATDNSGDAVSSFDKEASATNAKVAGAADENKRAVTVTGKILSSKGTPIEGREVSLKLGSETVWTGTSLADGVVTAKYEIPLAVADESKTYTFVLASDGAADKEVTLTYVSSAQEVVILGQLAGADTAGVKTFIENPEYQAMFDINPNEDMKVFAGFDKTGVYAQLANLKVNDVNDFRVAYNKAIILETINQATGATDEFEAVKAILNSEEDCETLGIDRAKIACITGENADMFVVNIAALNVASEKTTLEEELAAIKALINDEINVSLAAQYNKKDAASLATATTSAYAGQGFDVSLDITPAQDKLVSVKFVIDADDETILDGAIVTSEYKYTKEIVDGDLVLVFDTKSDIATVATDFKVGKLTLAAPASAGTTTIKLSGALSFDEGIPYMIESKITPTTITLTTTENKSEGSFSSSSSSAGGTASKPKPQEKPEEQKPEDKPGVSTPPVEEKPVSNFKDLAGNEWAIEAINALYNKGIISDNAEKTFRPNDNVTREEFVKMIIEALGLVHETYETDLNDVQKGAWYYPYVATAVEKGIVLGDENGNFRIGEKISRQDMAVIIIRVLSKLEHPYDAKSTKFADDKEISDYAKDAMYAAKNLAIINGVGDNMCSPRGTATRAMAAKVIYEMIRTVGL